MKPYVFTDEDGREYRWVDAQSPTLWQEFRAQSFGRLLLNAVAGVVLVVCVIAFGWLVL